MFCPASVYFSAARAPAGEGMISFVRDRIQLRYAARLQWPLQGWLSNKDWRSPGAIRCLVGELSHQKVKRFGVRITRPEIFGWLSSTGSRVTAMFGVPNEIALSRASAAPPK